MQTSRAERCGSFLATDLDGTLVGDDQAYASLMAYLKSLPDKVCLAYITGRHFRSVLELIEEKALAWPDFLITDVGTSIRVAPTLTVEKEWQERMRAGWEPEAIRTIGRLIEGLHEQDLPDDIRVSFTVDHERAAYTLKQKLAQAAMPHTFVFSSGSDVDILPEGGGKGEALKYLVSKYTKPDARILVAGDSGNDRAMLASGFPAVIVANAQRELADLPDHPLIFRATQSYAAGILEGWQHFFGTGYDF